MNVVMYVKPGCPWCAKARRTLKSEGVQIEERDATVDDGWRSELMGYTNGKGIVPTIVRGDQVQVGFPPGRG